MSVLPLPALFPGFAGGKMVGLIVALICGLGVSGCSPGESGRLEPFRSDGCSAFPDGPPADPRRWRDECVRHDLAYWRGGTRQERKAADWKLREGVCRKGHPFVANLIYLGVRVGGTPWLPFPWRWGFGWQEFPRGYRPVSGEEERIIRATLESRSLPGAKGEETSR